MHIFQKKGLYDRDMAGKVEKVFAAGNTVDNRTLARSFTGHTPKLHHYLDRQGLLKERFDYSAALAAAETRAPARRRPSPVPVLS